MFNSSASHRKHYYSVLQEQEQTVKAFQPTEPFDTWPICWNCKGRKSLLTKIKKVVDGEEVEEEVEVDCLPCSAMGRNRPSSPFCEPLGFDIDDMLARRRALPDKLASGAVEWDDIPQATQELFAGVANGWWEDVDVARGMPIPFPKVFDLLDRPAGTEHFNKMAQVLAHFNVFDSVSKAMKNGWNKPITTGEFWLNRRTIRILIVSVGPDDPVDTSLISGILAK